MKADTWALLVAAMLCGGCAKGSEADPFTLADGLYELSTVAVEGECKLDDAISPGSEHVGKVVRAVLTATDTSVRLELCDDFFPDDCLPASFAPPLTFVRDEHLLLADEPSWVVPCGFDDYTGARSADGEIVDNNRVALSWSFELPAPPPGYEVFCPGYQSCSATVSQLLVAR